MKSYLSNRQLRAAQLDGHVIRTIYAGRTAVTYCPRHWFDRAPWVTEPCGRFRAWECRVEDTET